MGFFKAKMCYLISEINDISSNNEEKENIMLCTKCGKEIPISKFE